MSELVALKERVERLHRWQEEAMSVLDKWHAAWQACGSPGEIGDSLSDALTTEFLDACDRVPLTVGWLIKRLGKPVETTSRKVIWKDCSWDSYLRELSVGDGVARTRGDFLRKLHAQ